MAMTDYSNIENEIADSQDPTVLPRGSEVKARIISVNDGVSDKNGAQWYMPAFDVPNDPLVMEFRDFFWELADKEKLDDKSFQRGLRKFKLFAEAFGLDYSQPFDWVDDLIGLEGWVLLGIKKSDEYGEQNTIQKYVVGQ
jgi:hypothetical protein